MEEKRECTQMNKIETDRIWVLFKKSPESRRFASSWQIAWIKIAFAQNHLVCDVMIILPVKELHNIIFEF